jgi:hypothetical protein
MTIFLRSVFLPDISNPGVTELGEIWANSFALFVICALLVATMWEYPERLIARTKKGLSTDRKARLQLLAKSNANGKSTRTVHAVLLLRNELYFGMCLTNARASAPPPPPQVWPGYLHSSWWTRSK